MPVYEYRRPDGSTFEVLQSFSDEALTHDPDTGVPVERVLHAPWVHIKGRIRERQRRLLDRAAEQGANEHDERFKAERPQHFKKDDLVVQEAAHGRLLDAVGHDEIVAARHAAQDAWGAGTG